MKKSHVSWEIKLGVFLLLLSVALYTCHYFLFHDSHHILIYMVGDIAFVPVEVLLVTIIIHGVLTAREKRTLLNKMNMAIGVFFCELGTDMLKMLCEEIGEGPFEPLLVRQDWSNRDFETAMDKAGRLAFLKSEIKPEQFVNMRIFLEERRNFLLGLLENPNLLEHQKFTDLLWATMHMAQELAARESFDNLPESDAKHLMGDIRRAFGHLAVIWLVYMQHLKSDYPYLFSLAVRTNPFDAEAQVTVS